MKSGIYQIINKITNKFYIGSAIDLKKRKREHFHHLNHNKHRNKHLQSSWNKHGTKIFEFHILEFCEIEKLLEREQAWIDWTNATVDGYNKLKIAGNLLGFKHSKENKLKFKNRTMTLEHKAALINSNIGRIISEETRKKMSEAGKRRKLEEQHKIKFVSAAAKANRKPDKWIHVNGWECKCTDCHLKRKVYHKEWRLKKKEKINANK